MNKHFKLLFILVCLAGIYIISLPCETVFSFGAIIDQEKTAYPFSKENNENPYMIEPYNSSKISKIPPITHHVWLTSSAKPKEISMVDIEHIINTLKILDHGHFKWQHILWTNDPQLIPRTVKILSEAGVEIRNINELENDVLQKDLIEMIKKNSFSEASDLVRYLALDAYGGVYNDTDYELFQPIDNLMQAYDLIAAEFLFYYYPEGDNSFDTLGSAFIAARKAHPVITQTVKLITRNLHDKNLPHYIKHSCSTHNQIWVKTGPMVFTIAFYQEGNHAGDNNVVFKSKYLYSRCDKKSSYYYPDALGCHGLNGNWYGNSDAK